MLDRISFRSLAARLAGVGVALLALFAPASALQSGLTKEEALRLAFPDCEIDHRIVYLTEKQLERAKKAAGVKVGSGICQPYVATKDGKLVGTAWFDVHKVRTKKEALMFVLDADHAIRRIEVLAFAEPTDYIPRDSWYAQFKGKTLDDTLWLNRGIRGVTGATLTARATTESARRILALHQESVVDPVPDEE